MCKCGCNTCETKSTLMLNENLAPRAILSEGLKHHIDNNKPLTEHLYRAGSSAYFNLIAEARSLYSRGILEFTNEDDLAILTETDLGHFGMFEGKKVPLDFPIELKEQMDIYDDIANMEFGMDYDQLGSNEKEWVRDEIDNMEMRESLNESDSNYPDFDLNKNIRYQDTSISSGMWRYTGKEQGGKGVYRNLNNGQILGFDRSDFDIFRKNLSSHFDFSESLNENEGKAIITFKNDYEVKMNTGEGYDADFEHFEAGEREQVYILDKNAPFQRVHVEFGDGTNAFIPKDVISVQEKSLNEDIYDKFLDNPSSPKGRAKSLILKFTKEYGDDASSMAVDRFASKNNLKPEEKYILKYITKNDIKISSQPGGPDFSAVSEAEFKGKDVPLNKPKRGGSKAYYVYVRDPKTKKIKKVSFGSGGLRAKINDKKARNAFAARHKCSTKKDKTKAGYWSCRLPRYAKLLGLKSNFSGFW